MDSYPIILALLGVALLGAAWLPHVVANQPISFPILYVAVGVLLYSLPLPLPNPDPIRYSKIAERLAEVALVLSLLSAGLRIDRRFNWTRWNSTWRLLAITMPLGIVLTALLGAWCLALPPAAALLLGAALAPTDPVLASDVQVGPPRERKDEEEVRFALTSEAGLNDGLAFPFVLLALLFAGHVPDSFSIHWLWHDLLLLNIGGAALGWIVGYMLMLVIFRLPYQTTLARVDDGIAAIAITLVVYGLAAILKVNGFVAVFVAAVTLRHFERDHQYHNVLAGFSGQCEHLLVTVLLVLLGGALVTHFANEFNWAYIVFAVLITVLVRPLSAYVSLLGSQITQRKRWIISVFGIRGIGSFFYLAYALNREAFGYRDELWAAVGFTVLLSILVHGIAATPVMRQSDRLDSAGRKRLR